MKNTILLLTIILVFGCKPEVKNDFDEIIHYSIDDSNAKLFENNEEFKALYNGLGTPINMDQSFENKLVQFRYQKKIIPKNKIAKINSSLENDLNLEFYETACMPIYRDILILKKDKSTKAIIKICFDCGMNESLGKIESNFEFESEEISNYQNLENLLKK